VRELGMQAFLKIKLHREVEPAGLETQEEQRTAATALRRA
jgi:hypothetical protein